MRALAVRNVDRLPASLHGCYRVTLKQQRTAWGPIIDAVSSADAIGKAGRIFLDGSPAEATFLHSFSDHSGPHTHQSQPDDLIRHHGHVIKLQRAG